MRGLSDYQHTESVVNLVLFLIFTFVVVKFNRYKKGEGKADRKRDGKTTYGMDR